ncbi:MAG: nuclease-related domain-containing protein [Bacillota bacterium]|nr:nuclease-related domain-containing protein [Bacillota bacterium]
MGQLIKLQDYVSRYEQDIFTYPSRFVRLKTQQWERTKAGWENEGMDASNLFLPTSSVHIEEERDTPVFLKKLKGFFKNSQEVETEVEEQAESSNIPEDPLQFSASFEYKPQTLEELKRQYLDQLYRFQLKWASSTVFEKSYFPSKFYFEDNLKFFLQRFPDTFLILYKPIFLLKNAPVEAEIILLTPTDLWCITFLEEENSAVFIGSNERFWIKRTNYGEKKVLNPLISLNRTGRIVRKILKANEIEFPVHKLVISRNGYIDYPAVPFDIKFAEARNFDTWFQSMRSLKSPLKHLQLKSAESLLQFCQTTSMRRPEWMQSEENS